jgi:hypothetical protein
MSLKSYTLSKYLAKSWLVLTRSMLVRKSDWRKRTPNVLVGVNSAWSYKWTYAHDLSSGVSSTLIVEGSHSSYCPHCAMRMG